MVENGQITVKQRRLINLYRMIRFQASGSMSVVLPSRKSYKLAAQVLLLLAILLLLSAITVWEVVSQIDGALPIAYTLGALIGFRFAAHTILLGAEMTIAACLRSYLSMVKRANKSDEHCWRRVGYPFLTRMFQ